MWEQLFAVPRHAGLVIRDAEGLVGRPSSPTLRAMRRHALGILEAGLRAVDPEQALRDSVRRENHILRIGELEIDLNRYEALRLLAFGKAAPAMARALLRLVEVREGLMVTDREVQVEGVRVMRGGHPLPDERSLRSGEQALRLAGRCGPRDLLVVLVSGGGSSMLEASELSAEDLKATTNLLLRCGADIRDLNTVRKHLSLLKGGQLAIAASARGGEVVTLSVSDVVGDDPSLIASGPTVPDPTTFADAKGVLQRHGLWESVPEAVRRRISGGVRGRIPETPKPGHEAFERTQYFIIADNEDACRAASEEARRLGYQSMILTTRLQGEAREVARVMTSIAISVQDSGIPLGEPAAIIAGGETTVTVRGKGRGGRNQELVLASVSALHRRSVVLLSCGTDGVDGSTEAAGAVADGESLTRAEALGMDPAVYLAENNSYEFFKRLGDVIVTGPTGTNVMDLQVVLIGCPSA
jgi:glycerate-2-kinase